MGFSEPPWPNFTRKVKASGIASDRYTGSDNEEDDFNDFSMNKGFIQYDL